LEKSTLGYYARRLDASGTIYCGVFLWLTHPIVEECYFIDLAIANMLYETILDFLGKLVIGRSF